MTKIAIWAAILSAFMWLMNSTLTHPRLIEVAQSMNKWAASFALISAVGLLVSEHWKDYQKNRQEKRQQRSDSFERIVSGNPATLAEFRAVDTITKPEK